MTLSLTELLAYTGEERRRWENWFRENGADLLKMPIAGERDTTAGALILHIFGPELRYVQRLLGEPLTEYRGSPSDGVEELFGFGLRSRKAMLDFVGNARPEEWGRVVDFDIADRSYRASVRKIVFHVLLHEIRHWAQIARIMRDRGFVPPDDHDLLTSSAME